MRALKRIGKAVAWCVAVVAVLALVVAGLRAYNANKYPIAQIEASGGRSCSVARRRPTGAPTTSLGRC